MSAGRVRDRSGVTASRGWTCQRTTAGKVCKHHNASRLRKCTACGKTRPARKKPAHMAALDIPYEQYIEINGGVEACGICGRPPSEGRRLDRDHEHKGDGTPRGLLCHICNRRLRGFVTVEWLLAALEYLKRANGRVGA